MLAAVLVLAAFAPEIEYRLGLVDTGSSPYPTKLESVEGPGPDASLPRGDRLVLPAIGVDVGVFEGEANACLREGTWHDDVSEDPGEGGNVVIAGHRNRGVFVLLPYMNVGNDVILYWRGEEYDYRVEEVFEVGPDEDWILERTDSETLTLYTCTPSWIGDRRVVVRAEPVVR